MADAVKAHPFPSIYVLGGHLQYKDPSVINIFNSEVLNNNTQTPTLATNHRRQSNTDIGNILNYQKPQPYRYGGNEKYNVPDDKCPQIEIDIEDDIESSLTDENRNLKTTGRLTRRLVNGNNDESEGNLSDDCFDEDARIDEKILRLKNYEKGFGADEKCDILKKMFTGFLSGILFPKNNSVRPKWRKRKSSDDLYREASMALGIPCEMTDSCRCLDCQCKYFDCGDTDSDTSEVSITMDECDIEEWPSGKTSEEKSCDLLFYEDEVQPEKKEPDEEEIPEAPKPAPAAGAENVEDPTLEIAAGTPVLLDHLLNNPPSCMLQ